MANATKYNIELRNKSGKLRQYLTPYAPDVKWEWNRIGGCGRCSIKLKMPYRKIDFNAGDDIQIRMPTGGSGIDFNTKLLLHGDGTDSSTTITDETGKTVTVVGNAQIDTAYKVFGTGSIFCPAAGDYLTLASNADWNFGTGNFTIDFRVMFSSLPHTNQLIVVASAYTDANNYWYLFLQDYLAGTQRWRFYVKKGGVLVVDLNVASSIAVDTWYHIALVRNGNSWTFRQNGIQVGDALTYSGEIGDSGILYIGWGVDIDYLKGRIDEFRISDKARWTADFTPPTKAYSLQSKLVYRGWVAGIVPSLKIPQEITLDVRGYFDLLDLLVVHDSGSKKTYTNNLVSAIVTDIIDTFVAPNSDITKGTIDTALFAADTLQFKCSASEALKTLAELEGQVEYGVDEDLVFFWRAQSSTLRKKFFIGDNVEVFERRIDWSKLLNKIYFEGGEVDGTPYVKTAEAIDSQSIYFLAEGIISNSSIVTSSVADQYLGAILKERSNPQLTLRFKIPNTSLRLEDTIPLGEVAVADPDYDQETYIVGETGDGGSDLTVGEKADGGSDALVGAVFQDQIDRIVYTLSNSEEKFNIEITLGDSILETSAKIKQLELLLSSLRQR